MLSYNKKRIIIIGGAASGKDHLKSELAKLNLKKDVSVTTRPMRPGEKNGDDYTFVEKSSFVNMYMSGKFLQQQEFNGQFYGTLKDSNGQVFIMNSSGLHQLDDAFIDESIVIFIDIPESVRTKRLVDRGYKGQKIRNRLLVDRSERDNMPQNILDIIITNPIFSLESISDLYSITWIRTNGLIMKKWHDIIKNGQR